MSYNSRIHLFLGRGNIYKNHDARSDAIPQSYIFAGVLEVDKEAGGPLDDVVVFISRYAENGKAYTPDMLVRNAYIGQITLYRQMGLKPCTPKSATIP